MKNLKYTLLLIYMIGLSGISNAQWSITGNLGTSTLTNFVGTTDNTALQFGTNGTINWMTLSTSGRLGIGLTAPQSLLHLYNSTNNSNVYHQFGTGSTGNGSGNGFRIGITYFGTNNTNDAEINQMENGPMNFYTFNVQRMVIKGGSSASSAGYVGIGNGFDTPVSRLHLYQGSSDPVTFQMTGNQTGNTASDGFRIIVTNTSGTSTQAVNLNQQENADMNFLTNAIPHASILANGNVAIGDYTAFIARNLLHQHITSTTGSTYHQFTNGNTAATAATSGFRIGITYNSITSKSDAELRQNENADMNFLTNALQRMTIKADGKVGVGIAAPANLMHLYAGNFQMSNSTTFSTINDGFTIGQNNSDVELKQLETAHINFFTHDGTSVAERMRLSSIGNLSIGTSNSGSNRLYAEVASSSATAYENAISGKNAEASGSGEKCGVRGECASSRSGGYYNTGGHFISSGCYGTNSVNAGVMGEATGTATTQYVNAGHFFVSAGSGIDNKGVYGEANTSSGTNNFGVYGKATGGSTLNYGIYGIASGTNAFAGVFDGDVDVNGVGTIPAIWVTSDQIFKTNVEPIPNAMNIISQLQPKSYYLDTTNVYGMRFTSEKQYGLIAQEVESVLPDLVHQVTKLATDTTQGLTYKALNYNALFGIILAGMQQQKAEIEALTAQLNGCCAQQRTTGDEGTNKSTIELQNLSTLQLLQNDPNPFSESTYVRWNIPNDFTNAVLYFYDQSGSRINTFEVKTKGQGELQIFGSKLSSGIYTYTLVVDGKVMDTKKMVKAAQ